MYCILLTLSAFSSVLPYVEPSVPSASGRSRPLAQLRRCTARSLAPDLGSPLGRVCPSIFACPALLLFTSGSLGFLSLEINFSSLPPLTFLTLWHNCT